MAKETPKAEMFERVDEAVERVVRKASPLSISLAVVIVALVGSVGLLIYFNKDVFISFNKAMHELDHLQQAHEECEQNMKAAKSRIGELEAKVSRLEDRLGLSANH